MHANSGQKQLPSLQDSRKSSLVSVEAGVPRIKRGTTQFITREIK